MWQQEPGRAVFIGLRELPYHAWERGFECGMEWNMLKMKKDCGPISSEWGWQNVQKWAQLEVDAPSP